jgi:branched-chain amino acid transport system substrate-binding protein
VVTRPCGSLSPLAGAGGTRDSPGVRSGKLWLAIALALASAAILFWRAEDGARGEPIHIAFAGPTTGPSADDGLSAVRAIELVMNRVNAAGGIDGRPLALDVYDDANDSKLARVNASKIADEPHTVAVIGHNWSSVSIAAGEVYASRGIPAVATAATSVGLTRDNPWYFRTIYNDRDQGRLMVLYLRAVLGLESVGIVHETEIYGSYLAEVMQEAAPQAGVDVAKSWSVDPTDPGLDARIAEIAREAASPDGPAALILALQPDAGTRLVRTLRDLSFPKPIIVSDALASQAFVKAFAHLPAERSRPGFYTDGIYASTPFLFDAGGKRAGDFLLEYVASYGESPDWYAAFAADAAAVLIEALRRAELSPGPQTIDEDRSALRDALAAVGRLDPVPGITGPTWFDALGDAEKPVPMGRFLSGEIVSAFGQLRLLSGALNPEELDPRWDPERVVTLGDRILYRTDVARVGVRAVRFGALDFADETFELDFNLWFRHEGDRNVEDVVFTNAIEPVTLGEPIDEEIDGDRKYRLYRVHGIFRTDAVDAGYGRHSMTLSLHHRERTRLDLVYALDSVGMNMGRGRTRAERGRAARQLLGANSDWTVQDAIFFESEVDEHALGHPQFLAGDSPTRPYSQLTIGILVRPQGLSARGLIPSPLLEPLLVLGLLGSAALVLLRGSILPKLRWVLQTGLAVLVLLAGEPLLGSWLRSVAQPYHLEQLKRAFDILWWFVPAVLTNMAIDRFIWKQGEVNPERQVPTLLRWVVSFLIYLLAFFGVVAFVYDYRLTGLLATSGVLAMIIGLAVQMNITNLFAGMALNLERPFRVGDWIMIHGRTPEPENGVIGKVIDINWRTTRLRTTDDTEILIPNGSISEKTITNFMWPHEMSRFELFFTIDQKHPADKVLEILRSALDEVTGPETIVPDPAPKARIRRATELGVEYQIRYRLIPGLTSPAQGRHLVNESVLRHLREAGIELAYPKRRIEP